MTNDRPVNARLMLATLLLPALFATSEVQAREAQTLETALSRLVDDPGCERDQGRQLQAVLDAGGGRMVRLPAGTFCVKDPAGTLRLSEPRSALVGEGRATTLKWAPPAGSPVAPLLDIRPEARQSTLRDLAFEGNAESGNYGMSAYFGANAWAGTLVTIQADDVMASGLWAADSFDNCFGILQIDPATNVARRGSPKRVTLSDIHTERCGSGVHHPDQGGPGRIGAGINNGSGSAVVISNAVDSLSYGSFMADIGAGGSASWNNITSLHSRMDKSNVPAIFVGDANNSFNNVNVIEPQGRGIWADFYATGLLFNNINIKAPKQECLYIKASGIWNNITCSDPSYSSDRKYSAVMIDTTAGAISNLQMSNLSVLNDLSSPNYSFSTIGQNFVDGRIRSFGLIGIEGAIDENSRKSGLVFD